MKCHSLPSRGIGRGCEFWDGVHDLWFFMTKTERTHRFHCHRCRVLFRHLHHAIHRVLTSVMKTQMDQKKKEGQESKEEEEVEEEKEEAEVANQEIQISTVASMSMIAYQIVASSSSEELKIQPGMLNRLLIYIPEFGLPYRAHSGEPSFDRVEVPAVCGTLEKLIQTSLTSISLTINPTVSYPENEVVIYDDSKRR